MPDYRLCFLDEAGNTTNVAEFSAPGDEEARAMSEDAAQGLRADLWRQDVLLAHFQRD